MLNRPAEEVNDPSNFSLFCIAAFRTMEGKIKQKVRIEAKGCSQVRAPIGKENPVRPSCTVANKQELKLLQTQDKKGRKRQGILYAIVQHQKTQSKEHSKPTEILENGDRIVLKIKADVKKCNLASMLKRFTHK